MVECNSGASGINYWETYAPVVNWISIRFLLILGEIVGLESQAIGFDWLSRRLALMFLCTRSCLLGRRFQVLLMRSEKQYVLL